MPAAPTDKLSLGHLRLEKKMVKIFECLIITLELNCCRRLLRQLRETQL
jgi:hypothetical protein